MVPHAVVLAESLAVVRSEEDDRLLRQSEPVEPPQLDELWQQRYDSIRDHEKHLARNGTVILKFWLNVSRDEQRKRFLARLEEPQKNWKFSAGDIDESALWKDYMNAYGHALNATSRPWAPWYAIPADHKPYMRAAVADIIDPAPDEVAIPAEQVDAIVIAPADSKALVPVCKRASDAGIVVVNIDNKFDAGALSEVIDLMLEIKGAWDAMPEDVRSAGGSKFATTQEAG